MVQFLNDNPEFQEQQVSNQVSDCSFFFFFPNPNIAISRNNCKACFGCSKIGRNIDNRRDADASFEEEFDEEFLYFDSSEDEVTNLKGVSMNQDFIFFWNTGQVWKLKTSDQELSKVGVYIDEKETDTFII